MPLEVVLVSQGFKLKLDQDSNRKRETTEAGKSLAFPLKNLLLSEATKG